MISYQQYLTAAFIEVYICRTVKKSLQLPLKSDYDAHIIHIKNNIKYRSLSTIQICIDV